VKPKPRHLEIQYANQYKEQSVVEAYQYRPPYPPETFEILTALISDQPRVVLDAGCGTGFIARNLIDFVDRIDAVDFSQAMIDKAISLPNGEHPSIKWIYGPMEQVPLHPPYALVAAGQSLHWMEWNVVLQRFSEILTPNGYLAIISLHPLNIPWKDEFEELIPLFSTNQDFQPYDLIEELEDRKLFQKKGEKLTTPVLYRQSIDDYIESFHSSNGFSRERMTRENVQAFDDRIRMLVSKYCQKEEFELSIVGKVIWGKPQ